MLEPIRHFGLKLAATLAILACLGQLPTEAQERFEVTSIKKVRPTIVNTIAALEQRNVAAARDAFEAYDSIWNGIEAYVNVRNRDLYTALEHGHQARISKGLEAANPDIAVLLPDAKAMLINFDEMVAFVEKQPPLNSHYDDVARLRTVRAHLREVPPALKAQKFDKARKSFEAFDDNWDSVEDLVKAKSAESYVAIESALIEVENALMPDKPDVDKVNGLVSGIMTRYNAALAEVVKDARAAR